MSWLADMYITLVPGIAAGILNMVWCTLPWARRLARPIDAGRTWRDGRRWFGDNKTWKGLIGMTGLGLVCTLAWSRVCAAAPALEARVYFYSDHANTLAYNTVIGLAIGLAYALFELPNSFLKRRLDIAPGHGSARTPGRGVLFVILDQIDSIIGLVLVVAVVHPLTIGFFLLYILVGGVTHALLNLLLFAARLRKNPL